MKTSESLLSIGKFIAEYSAHLMGAGVHTSRVVRNSKRIGEAFGLDVKLGVFHKNIILTIIDKETNEACNEVIDIPAHPISFEHNSELSALSWEAVGEQGRGYRARTKRISIHHSLSAGKLQRLCQCVILQTVWRRLNLNGNRFLRHYYRIIPETADAKEENESLYYIHCFGLRCVALCFYRLDFRHNFRDRTGNQRPISCTRCSFD